MTRPVKKRPYTSTVRQEQAAGTRARIVEAAATLFAEHGYVATTIRAIADKAGVAADTVYAVFGTKAKVLTALIDARLAPAGETSVMARPAALAVRNETDQVRQIQLFAADMAAVSTRVRPVYELLQQAAAAEPGMAAVLRQMDEYRLANMRQVAAWMATAGDLRASVDRAAETLWVLASPDVGRLLCDGLGWSEEQHASWLADTLTRTLL